MKRFWALIAIAALSGCAGTGSVTTASTTLTASAPADTQMDDLVDTARRNGGRAPVQPAAPLNKIALAHAQDMTRRGYFSHTSPEGEGLSGRLARAGVRSCASAENIAAGHATAAGAMASWLASAPHRANVLNGRVTAYGVGQSSGTWVLVLAQPC